MNKVKFLKIALPLTVCAILLPAIISTSVSYSIIQNKTNVKMSNSYYLYDGQYFNSLEEATNYSIVKNKPISSDFYIGNATDAIFDRESGRLNINQLRLAYRTKLYPAYKNSLNQYVSSYEEAKRSFVNPGLIQYKYDDLNGRLFNSYEEAKESMTKNKNSIPVMYHKMNFGGDVIKLNPYSIDDINEFKWLSLENLMSSKNDSPFSLSIYTKNLINENEGIYEYSNELDRLFSFEYSYLETVDFVLNKFLQMKYEYLNQFEYDVNLKFVKMGKASGYRIRDFSFDKRRLPEGYNQNMSVRLINDSNIRFSNINFSDISQFNKYLSKGQFKQLGKLWINRWALNHVAENMDVRNFLGANFNIRYEGSDMGAAGGTDIKILEKGTESTVHSELKFDVQTMLNQDSIKNKELIASYNNYFSYDNFKEKFSDQISQYTSNEFADKYFRYIWEGIVNNLQTDNQINTVKTFYKGSNIVSKFDLNSNNINWSSSEYLDNNYFSNKKDYEINSIDYINTNIGCDPKQELIKELKIDIFFEKNLKYLDYVINYNNYPIFKVLDLGFIFQFPKDKIENNSTKDLSLIKWSKLKELLQNKNQSNFKTITTNLVNISQNYSQANNVFKFSSKIINDKEVFLNDRLYYDNNYNLKYTDDSLNNNLISPSLSGDENSIHWENNAIGAFNKSINKIMDKYKEIPQYTKNKLIKPNEILNLKNESGRNLGYHYGEILSRQDDINISVMYNDNLKIFYDQKDIDNAIKNTMATNPAKVVILYDLMGNIINPGVKLSESEELLTTNDAIYDSESIILDNILRTKIIRNDPTKVFYLENDNKTYTLLDNKSQLIYNLNIENKIYYFSTYNDAWKYYYDYVKLNAIKVVK